MSMSAWGIPVTALSPRGDYFAHSSPDGSLKIWEVATGFIKTEYVPSSHLSASFSCLSWGQSKTLGSPKRKKHKPVNNVGDHVAELNLIAMGTSSGNILLYSMTKNDVHTEMGGGHDAIVNDVRWHTDSDSIFSCSSDHHIVHWTISSGQVKQKWKADKSSIFSLCILDSTNLISASCIIKWWDLTTKSVLKKFTGHAAEVFRLLSTYGLKKTTHGNYFVSAAVGDRIINMWELQTDNDNNRTVDSFILSDEPLTFDVAYSSEQNQCMMVAAVTKSGVLHIYEHNLNRRHEKATNPKITIRVISEGRAEFDTKPKPIPILAAQVCEVDCSIIVAYGNYIRPVFERISLQNCSSEVWLIRQGPLATTVTLETAVTKIKQPERPNDVKLLVPGYTILTGPLEPKSEKRKQEDSQTSQLPLEEKLNTLSLTSKQKLEEIDTSAMVENLTHLLVQGLQSKDAQLLGSVLQRSDERIIKNTIKKLPLSCITSLVDELYKMLQYRGQKNLSYVRWLKELLLTHMSYLMTCYDIDSLLGPIYYMLEARTETFSDMSNLSGSLRHLLAQVEYNGSIRTENETEALLLYEESSSEEMEHEEVQEGATSDDDFSPQSEEEL